MRTRNEATDLWVLLSFIGLGLASCAGSPQAAIEGATSALQEARSASGKGYAPEALKEAEKAYVEAMAEVKSQDERSYFLRTYGTATDLLTRVIEESKEATKEAEARREEMHAEADTLISDVQKRFQNAETTTAKLQGRPRELARLKKTLEKAGAGLFEAEKAFKGGDFLSAYERAQDAQALIDEVMSDENLSGAKRPT